MKAGGARPTSFECEGGQVPRPLPARPLASETVMPATPGSDKASRTSSSRNGLMMATMRFVRYEGLAGSGGKGGGIAAQAGAGG